MRHCDCRYNVMSEACVLVRFLRHMTHCCDLLMRWWIECQYEANVTGGLSYNHVILIINVWLIQTVLRFCDITRSVLLWVYYLYFYLI